MAYGVSKNHFINFRVENDRVLKGRFGFRFLTCSSTYVDDFVLTERRVCIFEDFAICCFEVRAVTWRGADLRSSSICVV